MNEFSLRYGYTVNCAKNNKLSGFRMDISNMLSLISCESGELQLLFAKMEKKKKKKKKSLDDIM